MSNPSNHPEAALEARLNRQAKRDADVCICGPLPPSARKREPTAYFEPHGPVVAAGKCARCLAVHARSR